jgi:hypothetical protein
MTEEKKISNNQKKKMNAQAHNAFMDISNNLMPIGKCGSCGDGILMVYLKSKLENSCTYYCMKCEHTGNVKNIDKKDSFSYPLKDIVGEIRKHYPEDEFDKFYNS